MLELLPPFFVEINALIFGVIIGSFLNVVIYRFHTGKSLSGSSHCLSCRHKLGVLELFPLLSYLWLRGRCKKCSAYIPSRYFWVELLTGLLFLLVVLLQRDMILWPLFFVLMATFVVVSVYDLYHYVIPNAFVWTLSFLALLYSFYIFYVSGDYDVFISGVCASVLSFSFFAGLWFYSKGRWLGFGDAKLAIPLAFMVGLGGVFSMLTLSFWIGTFISLFIIVIQKYLCRGQLGLPFRTAGLTIKYNKCSY